MEHRKHQLPLVQMIALEQSQNVTADLVLQSAKWHGYVEAASQTALIWNYLLTLDTEVKLIWRWQKPWSWTTFLFLANRYLPIVAQAVNTIGEFSLAYWLVITSVAQLIVTDTIVWLCVCALYGNNKRIKYPLPALYVVAVICSITITGTKFKGIFIVSVLQDARIKLEGLSGTSNPAPEVHQCVLTTTPSELLWIFWIPIMRCNWTSELLEMILKDTMMYLVIILSLFIADAVFFANPDPSLAGVIAPVAEVMLSILVNRMLFNLRAQSAVSMTDAKEENDDSAMRAAQSAIRFNHTLTTQTLPA
ncbi:hypothetical protein BDQ17DRAFT_1434376 [Cyathus striatus]|nr:hypothetical protein BDQ17DRAFT_1434376 [Cyathus striatus]